MPRPTNNASIGSYDEDDDLLEAVRAGARGQHRVYAYPGTAVVLGRGSKPAVELNQDACAEDGVELLRRRGGGCAVLLDPGNIIVSAVLPAPGLGNIRRHFDTLSAWMIEGLAAAGVRGVVHRDVCDLCLGNRKIGGACLYRTKDLVYYSTTLLVTPDLGAMTRYLAHPPREPDYRRGRAHTDFVTTLADHGVASAAGLLEALRALPPLPSLT